MTNLYGIKEDQTRFFHSCVSQTSFNLIKSLSEKANARSSRFVINSLSEQDDSALSLYSNHSASNEMQSRSYTPYEEKVRTTKQSYPNSPLGSDLFTFLEIDYIKEHNDKPKRKRTTRISREQRRKTKMD